MAQSTRVTLPLLIRAVAKSLPRLPLAIDAGRAAVRSDKNIVDSIGVYLESNARRFGASAAVKSAESTLSHSELNRRVNRTARALAGAGVLAGDSVALVLSNRVELFVVVGALAKLGAVAAMINTNQRRDVLAHSFEVARCSFAVVGEELWDAVAPVRDRAALRDDGWFWLADAVDSCGTGRLDGPLPQGAPAGAVDLGALSFNLASDNPPWTRAVRLGSPSFYIFTSGTTGLPKASIMTHMRWSKAGYAYGRAMLALTPNDCVYAPLPLYHNMALSVAWGSAAVTGASVAIRRSFSASNYWSDCREFDATALAYIGELPRYLLAATPHPEEREHRVRAAVGVGLRPDVWGPFQERFGIAEVFETYAASEGNTIFLNAFNVERSIGICPTPHAIVAYDVEADAPVRDLNGRLQRVPSGEVGLLIGKVSARFDFDGYTDREASEEKLIRGAFREGDVWFNSGDLLRKVGWGHAEFVDRVGDTFRWKSENVATGQVEAVLNTFKGVAETTVYGVLVPKTEGRAGMAALTLDGSTEDFELGAFATHASSALPAYAVPVFLRVRARLEVTGTFKHQKTALRDEGWNSLPENEPVFVRISGRYERLTADLSAAIEAGSVRL